MQVIKFWIVCRDMFMLIISCLSFWETTTGSQQSFEIDIGLVILTFLATLKISLCPWFSKLQGQRQGKLLEGEKISRGPRGSAPWRGFRGESGRNPLKLTPFKCLNCNRSPLRSCIFLFKIEEKPILITPTHECTQSLLIFPFSENHRGAFAPLLPCGTAPGVLAYYRKCSLRKSHLKT